MSDGSSVASRRHELRQAVKDLRERGLYTSAKWAAEQLAGLPPITTDQQQADAARRAATRAAASADQEADAADDDAYLLARSHFDLKEYRRCAHLLQGLPGARATFLRCYALYLAGERRKEEAQVEGGAVPGGRQRLAANPELEALEAELAPLHNSGSAVGGGGDAYTGYLLGLVLLDREEKCRARDALVASAAACPCNWGCWQALQLLATSGEELAALSCLLPEHWARDFFVASVCLDLQANHDALQRLQSLSGHFPGSEWVAASTASAQYNLRNFDEAQELFEGLLERDPYRIEGMDGYSNVLYVKEQFAKLSHLAHHAAATDRYRPETCCIVGNYYSLRGQHEKAVLYFRRALRLDPHYLSAWTLMGHEHVEMKNPAAAIEAYRRAVDINPRDYRAWYGLGQTYELVQEPYYALYYYRRAAELRPGDARMWCAMGQCYEGEALRRPDAAVRCYRRAVANGDREGIALHKLACLHEQLAQRDAAAHYHRLNVARIDADGLTGSDLLDALCFLADYCCRDTGELEEAEEHCTRLLDYGNAQYKERAKSLLREIRQRQEEAGVGVAAAGGMGGAPAFATPMASAPSSPGGSGSDLDMSPMT